VGAIVERRDLTNSIDVDKYLRDMKASSERCRLTSDGTKLTGRYEVRGTGIDVRYKSQAIDGAKRWAESRVPGLDLYISRID
jgi:hypothetical protein